MSRASNYLHNQLRASTRPRGWPLRQACKPISRRRPSWKRRRSGKQSRTKESIRYCSRLCAVRTYLLLILRPKMTRRSRLTTLMTWRRHRACPTSPAPANRTSSAARVRAAWWQGQRRSLQKRRSQRWTPTAIHQAVKPRHSKPRRPASKSIAKTPRILWRKRHRSQN